MEGNCELLVLALVYTAFFVLDVFQSAHAAMILDGGVVAFTLELIRGGGFYGL